MLGGEVEHRHPRQDVVPVRADQPVDRDRLAARPQPAYPPAVDPPTEHRHPDAELASGAYGERAHCLGLVGLEPGLEDDDRVDQRRRSGPRGRGSAGRPARSSGTAPARAGRRPPLRRPRRGAVCRIGHSCVTSRRATVIRIRPGTSRVSVHATAAPAMPKGGIRARFSTMLPSSALTLITMLSRLRPIWLISTADGAASDSMSAPPLRMSTTATPSWKPGPKIERTAVGAAKTSASGTMRQPPGPAHDVAVAAADPVELAGLPVVGDPRCHRRRQRGDHDHARQHGPGRDLVDADVLGRHHRAEQHHVDPEDPLGRHRRHPADPGEAREAAPREDRAGPAAGPGPAAPTRRAPESPPIMLAASSPPARPIRSQPTMRESAAKPSRHSGSRIRPIRANARIDWKPCVPARVTSCSTANGRLRATTRIGPVIDGQVEHLLGQHRCQQREPGTREDGRAHRHTHADPDRATERGVVGAGPARCDELGHRDPHAEPAHQGDDRAQREQDGEGAEQRLAREPSNEQRHEEGRGVADHGADNAAPSVDGQTAGAWLFAHTCTCQIGYLVAHNPVIEDQGMPEELPLLITVREFQSGTPLGAENR